MSVDLLNPVRMRQAALAVALCASGAAVADDLTGMDLEQLMAVQVTGVSRRAEALGTTPAAVFVLNGDDIRRSGARTIAEALRLVPGLDVARTSAQGYAISSRGFNATSADKLEVIVDGRSVYSPLVSAVFWDVLDTYLPDIERIEVIRGPGGTVWGANAVNGVINIVTRSSADTQGEVLSAGGGTSETAFGAFRAGGRIGANGTVRAYAKATERDHLEVAGGDNASDGQLLQQAGLRMDYRLSPGQQLTVTGDLYDGHADDANGRTDVHGANVVGRWKRAASSGAETSVQFFVDTYDRDIPAIYSEDRQTYDLDLQHSFRTLGANTVTVGAAARVSRDDTGGPPRVIIFDPDRRTTERYSAFAQDQVTFGGGRGQFMFGSKIEHNDFTGTEYQPGVRAGWQAGKDWFLWSSISRAVRTPNRLDHDIAVFCAPEFADILGCEANTIIPFGNRDFDAEKLVAYETGLRATLSPSVLVEFSLFYNEYSDLKGSEPATGIASSLTNEFDGRGAGGEIDATWRISDSLRLTGYYAYLDLELDRKSGGTDPTTEAVVEGSSPKHQASFDLAWRIAPAWEAGGQLRYVSRLARTAAPSASNPDPEPVPDYTSLNVRVRWQALPSLALTLAGRDLLERRHPEFGASPARSEVERSGYLEAEWTWD